MSLLWLAPDHVHLYVESSTAEKSAETMIEEIKRYSNKALLEKFIDSNEKIDKGSELWDAAYFIETVG